MTDDLLRQTAENLLLEHELIDAVRLLEAARIEVVVLKGVPLTLRLHGRLDARRMVDNDLLVHRADGRRAFEVLVEHGYRPLLGSGAAEVLGELHEVALARDTPSGRSVTVDLHWALAVPTLFPIDEALLWSRTESFSLRVGTVRVLDAEMSLLHLASHVLQHRFGEPRILQDLAAAWRVWGDRLDRAELEQLGRRTGLWHALVAGSALCQERGLLEQIPLRLTLRARVLAGLGRRRHGRVDRSFYVIYGFCLDVASAGAVRAVSTFRHALLPGRAVLAASPGSTSHHSVLLQHSARLGRALVALARPGSRQWPDAVTRQDTAVPPGEATP